MAPPKRGFEEIQPAEPYVANAPPVRRGVGCNKMRVITVSVLMVTLLLNCTFAEEAISLSAIVKMFEERDLRAIQNTPPQVIAKLSLKERNEAAVAAAKSLSIKNYIGAIGTNSINTHFTKPPAQDSPEEAECRKQLGINWSAASLLQHLAEHRTINDPRILPLLIDGLDHPDRGFVGQKCFYALKRLTYHQSGDAYWGRLVEDNARHQEIVSWWRSWWQDKKDRHPVFDQDAETRSRTLVMDLARRIEAKIKPSYPGLTEFSVPEHLPLHGPPSPLFEVEFNPRHFADMHPKRLDRTHLPWVSLICELATADLPEPANWSRPQRPSPPKELQPHVQEVYSQVIEGTDIRVIVRAASEETELLKAMERVLKEETSTQPSPAGDSHPARRGARTPEE